MKPRKPLSKMGQDDPPQTIAGKPADVCPYCGCAMFKDRTQRGEQVTFRYVSCRNSSCGKRFFSKQPPEVLVREIGSDEDIPSSDGNMSLTLIREIA